MQAFKCGPDYIDPAFHAAATGPAELQSRHLGDGRDDTRRPRGTTCPADIAITEGVMGLFDGVAAAGQTARGATADLAALLGWPVLLVLDVSGQTETAAAVAAGLARYRDDVASPACILNRVGEPAPSRPDRAGPRARRAEVFGALGRRCDSSCRSAISAWSRRTRRTIIDRRLDALADAIEAPSTLQPCDGRRRRRSSMAGGTSRRPPGQRIALARDRAFSFMYPHLLEDWRSAGAEILPFSPLADEAPDQRADVVWLPGGYPELHGGVLAAARRFQDGLHVLAARSVPIHGECGGYMVLGQGIEDAEGQRHSMAGLLQVETSFAKRRLHIGYRRARLLADGPLGSAGELIMGHEFHYASVLQAGDEPLVDCRDATGAVVAEAGARRGSVSGTFFHAIDGLRHETVVRSGFSRAVPRPRVVAARCPALSPRSRAARAHRCADRDRHPCAVGGLEPALALRARRFTRTAAGRHQSFTDANERALAGYSGEKQRRRRAEAGRTQGGAGSPRGALRRWRRTPAAASAGSRPCPRRCIILSSPRSRPCGWRRGPTASGWLGVDPRSAAVTQGARRAEVVEPRRPLCLGLPAEEHLDPELERHHWEQRTDLKDVVFTRWGGLTLFTPAASLAAVVPARDQKGTRCMPAHKPAAAPATVSGELATRMPLGRRKAPGKVVEARTRKPGDLPPAAVTRERIGRGVLM